VAPWKAELSQSSNLFMSTARWMSSSGSDVGLIVRDVYKFSICITSKYPKVLQRKSIVAVCAVGKRFTSMSSGVVCLRWSLHSAGDGNSSGFSTPCTTCICRKTSWCFSPRSDTVGALFPTNSAVGGAGLRLPVPLLLRLPILSFRAENDEKGRWLSLGN